jgi:hypothetical protein
MTVKVRNPGRVGRWILRSGSAAAVVALNVGLLGLAQAEVIETGNPDLSIRWDNSLRFELAGRVDDVSRVSGLSSNYGDGDNNYASGLTSSRLDVLSEFDFVYRKDFGFRVSGAGWYDPTATGQNDSVTSVETSNHLVNGLPAEGVSRSSERYQRGLSGELLDAFVFDNFNVGDVPGTIRVGRHTEYWGESILIEGGVNGIEYAQSPIDLAKGLASPGAELKELFRPENNVSLSVRPTDNLSISGQYFLEWEPWLYPQAGSYFSFADPLQGAESIVVLPATIVNGTLVNPGARLLKVHDSEPSQNGDWGVSARWSPEFLDGTAGLYYRNFSDKQPSQANFLFGALPTLGDLFADSPRTAPLASVLGPNSSPCTLMGLQSPGGGLCLVNLNNLGGARNAAANLSKGILGNYNYSYKSGIDLWGFSLAKQIGGISFGLDANYREGMPLISQNVYILPSSIPAEVAGITNNLCRGATTTFAQLPGLAQYGFKGNYTCAQYAKAYSKLPADLQSVLAELGAAPSAFVGDGALITGAVQQALAGSYYGNLSSGQDPGAIGNTGHIVLNGLGTLTSNRFFDTAIWIVEGTYAHWFDAYGNETAFKGGNNGYHLIDRATRDSVGVAFNFTPTWFEVFPSVDLSLPLTFTDGVFGNSPVQGGGNANMGNWSAGISANIEQQYTATLTYTGFTGNYSNGSLQTKGNPIYNNFVPDGPLAPLADRGLISLTLKATF